MILLLVLFRLFEVLTSSKKLNISWIKSDFIRQTNNHLAYNQKSNVQPTNFDST